MIAQRALAVLLTITTLSVFSASPLLAENIPEPEALEPSVRTVSITIRDGVDVFWSGEVSVPDSDTATTSLLTTDGAPADVLAASALAALVAADESTPEFSISNLQYFSSYGSFYAKCITASVEKCDNWQYAVGEIYPSVGMGEYILHNGETFFVYFGSPRRVTLSSSTIMLGESVAVTAEKYVPASDIYTPAVGVTLGITQVNPDDPYTPLVIATSTADAAGQAIFTLAATGTYAVGIAEDYFYPSEILTVIEASAEEPEPEEAPPAEKSQQSSGGSGGGGGGGAPTHAEVNIPAAISFLSLNQNPDGSFATPLLTDWAAIAFAATPEYESGETMLRRHLVETSRGLSSLTDYERRAMALMALSVNPYTDTDMDYIGKILSYFDGSQFGDASLVNDDIFALFLLLQAGYGASDDVMQKTVQYILSKQKTDGSWDSVDLTAAAIQGLMPVHSLPGVSASTARANEFLHAQQESNGGFGNSFSTSWALQAINAQGDDMAQWQPNGKNPEDYLASVQSSDGGIEPSSSDARTRVWASAYAIPAALEMSWHTIMQEFARPAPAPTQSAVVAAPEFPKLEEVSATSPTETEKVMSVAERAPLSNTMSSHIENPAANEVFTKPLIVTPSISKPVPHQLVAAAAATTESLSFLEYALRWIGALFVSLRALFV